MRTHPRSSGTNHGAGRAARLWPVALAALLLAACSSGGSPDAGSDPLPGAGSPPPASGTTPVAGWGTQLRIGNSRDSYYYDIYSPDVALSDNGAAAAVWQEHTDGGDRVWASRHAGGGWGAPLSIGMSQSHAPSVAIDATGRAIAVWHEATTDGVGITSDTVWAAHHDGSGWSAPVRLSDAPTNDYEFYAFGAKVAMDPAGNAFAVWIQDDPDAATVRSIWAARWNGSAWSAPMLLSSGDRHSEEPRVAFDGLGNAIAVWRQNTNAFDPGQPVGITIANIWARRYSGGAWGGAERIGNADLTTNEYAERPRLAVNAAGNAVVAWEEQRSGERSMIARAFDAGGAGWGDAVVIDSGTDTVAFPAVAIDPAGNAVAVWQQHDGTHDNAWTNRYDAGLGSWGTAELLETVDTDARTPLAGMDDNGNTLVVWSQSQLQARHHLTVGGWQATAPIGGGDPLAMDVNGVGQAVVVSVRQTFNSTTPLFTDAVWAVNFTP